MKKKIVASGKSQSVLKGSTRGTTANILALKKSINEWKQFAKDLVKLKRVSLCASEKKTSLCSLNYSGSCFGKGAPGDIVRIAITDESGHVILDVDGVLLFVHVPKGSGLSGRGIIESQDWSKQFVSLGYTRESFITRIRRDIEQRSITNSTAILPTSILSSASVQFMFGQNVLDEIGNSEVVRNNPAEFERFFKHLIARIYQCEPRTNIRLNLLSLIDTQSILNSKHSLAAMNTRVTNTPTLQMFKRRGEKLEWRNIIDMPPAQYDNIAQRPRDIFALWFAVNNSRVIDKNVMLNHTILTGYQILAVGPRRLFPTSTRRNTNSLAAMNFDNPKATITELGKREAHDELPEGIERIFLGQELETGVNDVAIVQTKLLP